MTGITHHAPIHRFASSQKGLEINRFSTPLREASLPQPPTERVTINHRHDPEPPKKGNGKKIALVAAGLVAVAAGGVMIAAAQPLPEVQMETLQRHERMAARDIGVLQQMAKDDGGGFYVPHQWTGHDVKAENPAQVIASMRDGNAVKYHRGEGHSYVDVNTYDELQAVADHYEMEDIKQDFKDAGRRIENEFKDAMRDLGNIFK